ncbi:hypothetical protein [Umezawaea beigongshangensis]|uniref:hypothetical protein n=1 Tax=Umezawaea beigongshangensis TaxID=2780383 RepID=UPI0018F1F507|nr:hypothetical protein [Umezawaea beigongshangensis]
MSSTSSAAFKAAKWVGGKAVGSLTQSRACCPAPTGKGGKPCGKAVATGRMADGRTCGRNLCQIWRDT